LRLPAPRGPLSSALIDAVRLSPGDGLPPDLPETRAVDVLADDDVQLALAVCYELHYRGFDDVDDGWEWDPALLSARRRLEARFFEALETTVPRPPLDGTPVPVALNRLIDADDSPSLSAYLMRHATLEQFREFVRQRSVYHLREADSHTWAIPRLHGRAKAALVEIQCDEYGGGRAEAMHSALFARTMRALGLDDSYGAHWGTAAAETFALTNLMSFFGLHRRWRGALLGHLAVFEMTSTSPNRRYGNGLRRLGLGTEATGFYDEHVEADAVHEQLAAVDMCGSFVQQEPGLTDDLLWGAACCLAIDGRFAAAMLDRFERETGTADPPPPSGSDHAVVAGRSPRRNCMIAAGEGAA
jgi:hypothetical protein